MARFKKWIDRVGEQKVVEGFTFTIVDNEGDKVIVEVADDLHYVSRGTWRKGVFRNILRVLKPKYVGEEKTIGGLLAMVYKYANNKVTVAINGCDEEFEIGANTWEKGIFRKIKNRLRKLGLIQDDLEVKQKQQEKQENEVTKYFLSVINEKPISADTIARHVNTLENILCFKELKQEFHKLAGIYHPDKGGNAQVFAQLAAIYNISAKVLRKAEKSMKARLNTQAYEAMVRKLINIERMEQGYNC